MKGSKQRPYFSNRSFHTLITSSIVFVNMNSVRMSAAIRWSRLVVFIHPLELVTADDVLARHPEEIRLQRTPELLELAEFDFTVLRPTGIGGLF